MGKWRVKRKTYFVSYALGRVAGSTKVGGSFGNGIMNTDGEMTQERLHWFEARIAAMPENEGYKCVVLNWKELNE